MLLVARFISLWQRGQSSGSTAQVRKIRVRHLTHLPDLAFRSIFYLAVPFGIEVAQGVGEIASISNLVLAGSRYVLHLISEEVNRRAPKPWEWFGEVRT